MVSYQTVKTLGEGSFGRVSTGYLNGVEGLEDTLIAIKEMYHKGDHDKQAIELEYKIQESCNHPNICKVVGGVMHGNIDGRPGSIFCLEYVPGGSLFDYIMTNGAFDDGMCGNFFN